MRWALSSVQSISNALLAPLNSPSDPIDSTQQPSFRQCSPCHPATLPPLFALQPVQTGAFLSAHRPSQISAVPPPSGLDPHQDTPVRSRFFARSLPSILYRSNKSLLLHQHNIATMDFSQQYFAQAQPYQFMGIPPLTPSHSNSAGSDDFNTTSPPVSRRVPFRPS